VEGGVESRIALEKETPDKGDPRLPLLLEREWRLLRAAMLFSLLKAFDIGFRDMSVGQWLRLLPRTEYDMKAAGWARTLGGVQALLSVCLGMLWLLTYFGHPFEWLVRP